MISQLESPCYEVQCDGCGEHLPLNDEGSWVHYKSVEEAREDITAQDWSYDEETGVTMCHECVEGEAGRAASPGAVNGCAVRYASGPSPPAPGRFLSGPGLTPAARAGGQTCNVAALA